MRGCPRVPGFCAVLAAAFALLALGGPAAADDWSVKAVPRPDGTGTRCVLESIRQSLTDGYQDTTAYVTVDDRSVVVTSASNLDPGTGRFLPPDQLRERYEALGVGSASEVVAYCGSGVTSAHDIVALRIAGYSRPRLYVGSWSEWITDPARPVARGD